MSPSQLSAVNAWRRSSPDGWRAADVGREHPHRGLHGSKSPRKVGRYHLEDYGSHDIIVENDVLYQAYCDGGVRIVDVSGMLLGNLYDQGREIAVFKPFDPEGYTPNAPFVMNAMPWKGHVLFTDFNSGLWAGKLEPMTTGGR